MCDRAAHRISLAREDSIDGIWFAIWLNCRFQYRFFEIGTGNQITDDRVTFLASDHNQFVSNVSQLSDLFQAEIQSRGEDVSDGMQISSSSEAVFGGVAEVASGVTSVSTTEGSQVTSRLSALTGRVSDSNFSSAGTLPRPLLPLDVMQSTMVTDPGRKFLPSLHTPAQAPIFSLGNFTHSFGRVASVTVQEQPVPGGCTAACYHTVWRCVSCWGAVADF